MPTPPSSRAPTPRSTTPTEPRGTTRFGAGLVVVMAVAALLRIWHLGEGLPDFVDESFPFRRAFEMAGWESGRVDWNPHAFHYSSLAIYLQMALQGAFYLAGRIGGVFSSPADLFMAYQVDPGPLVLTGRLFGVACDLATILGAAVIGERLRRGTGLMAAVLLGVSPALILGTRTIGVDAPTMAFAVWALERLLAWQSGGARGAWVGSVVLIGLAAGTKYPGGLVWIPLAWAAVRRDGPAGLRRALGAALVSGAILLATSPFLLVELARVSDDARKIGFLLSAGQLGSFSGGGEESVLKALGASLGWPAVVLCAAAAPLAFGGDRIARGWALVWIYVLAFAVPTALTRVPFGRYLLPALPGLALLASAAVFAIADRAPQWGRGAALAVLIAALGIAPTVSGLRASASGAETTSSLARRWMEAHVPDSALVVEEPYTAPLQSCPDAARILRSSAYANTDDRWKARFGTRRTFHVVTLPLLVSGRAAVGFPSPDGKTRFVDLWPSSADLNQVFYDSRLFREVDFVATSAAIRGRYQADPARYPRQLAFYQRLDREATEVASFRSGAWISGPEIRVYRLDERWRRALTEAPVAFDPLWWAEEVPDAPRRTISAMIARAESVSTSARGTDGEPAAWVRGLSFMFDRQIAPFCYSMAAHLAELGRFRAAGEFAGAVLQAGSPDAAKTRAAERLLADLPQSAAGAKKRR